MRFGLSTFTHYQEAHKFFSNFLFALLGSFGFSAFSSQSFDFFFS